LNISEFWNQVDQEIARYDLLKHPFYEAWSAGELTAQDLRFYGEQYSHQVSAFPTYLTALHSRLPEGAMRRDLLANAYEEECEGSSHSELWLRFFEGMGGNAAEMAQKVPIPEVRHLVETFRTLATEAPGRGVWSPIRVRISSSQDCFRETQRPQAALLRGRPHMRLLRTSSRRGHSSFQCVAEDYFGVSRAGRAPRRGSASRRFSRCARPVDGVGRNRARHLCLGKLDRPLRSHHLTMILEADWGTLV
jgi:hypothetical protein